MRFSGMILHLNCKIMIRKFTTIVSTKNESGTYSIFDITGERNDEKKF